MNTRHSFHTPAQADRRLRRLRALPLALAFSAALVAGCSSVALDDGAVPVETRTPSPVGAGAGGAGAGAGAGGAGQSRVTPVDLTNGAASAEAMARAQRIVYFDFDSYVVKNEYRPVIELHAKLLSADRKKHLQVEGHTDERGGREYNLALGQKRAESVAKSLALLGALDSQVEAVSFGKERPAVEGSDEEAWAKNRRAELNYR